MLTFGDVPQFLRVLCEIPNWTGLLLSANLARSRENKKSLPFCHSLNSRLIRDNTHNVMGESRQELLAWLNDVSLLILLLHGREADVVALTTQSNQDRAMWSWSCTLSNSRQHIP